jgi:hypothetical protein
MFNPGTRKDERLELRLQRRRLEPGQLAAAQTQAMGQVVRQLLAGQPRQAIAHHDSLSQRCVHRHLEAPAQLGEAHQQQTEPILRIHPVVGQQPQILQHLVARMMGLIPDRDGRWRASSVRRPISPRIARKGAARLRSIGSPSSRPMDLVHVQHIAGRERHIEHPIQPRVQGGGHLVAYRGLARAGLAGHQTDGAQHQQMRPPPPTGARPMPAAGERGKAEAGAEGAGGPLAFDEAVGVGLHHSGRATDPALMTDLQRALGGAPGSKRSVTVCPTRAASTSQPSPLRLTVRSLKDLALGLEQEQAHPDPAPAPGRAPLHRSVPTAPAG